MTAIHHLAIDVSDFDRSSKFYDPLLSWLGFQKAMEDTGFVGYVKDGFLLVLRSAQDKSEPVHGAAGIHHLSFSVDSREAVNQFYNEVLLKMDAVEIEDPPVDCPEYMEGFYATFFYDPDGIKLEVTYTP
ncbi:VOC family protein [Candidatus Poribacteria bacterium]|nr:VOC family protein [Candidatus Poribacteria bacterium]